MAMHRVYSTTAFSNAPVLYASSPRVLSAPDADSRSFSSARALAAGPSLPFLPVASARFDRHHSMKSSAYDADRSTASSFSRISNVGPLTGASSETMSPRAAVRAAQSPSVSPASPASPPFRFASQNFWKSSTAVAASTPRTDARSCLASFRSPCAILSAALSLARRRFADAIARSAAARSASSAASAARLASAQSSAAVAIAASSLAVVSRFVVSAHRSASISAASSRAFSSRNISSMYSSNSSTSTPRSCCTSPRYLRFRVSRRRRDASPDGSASRAAARAASGRLGSCQRQSDGGRRPRSPPWTVPARPR
mmetsp:Transcript_3522/g.10885  ORF Transcript_3522/g.10885 Transcript_3522/m.10885 type:complete len:313 (+) Transcript_3522:1572-2510(+)